MYFGSDKVGVLRCKEGRKGFLVGGRHCSEVVWLAAVSCCLWIEC